MLTDVSSESLFYSQTSSSLFIFITIYPPLTHVKWTTTVWANFRLQRTQNLAHLKLKTQTPTQPAAPLVHDDGTRRKVSPVRTADQCRTSAGHCMLRASINISWSTLVSLWLTPDVLEGMSTVLVKHSTSWGRQVGSDQYLISNWHQVFMQCNILPVVC